MRVLNARRADLLARNDHMVMLAEMRYRDAWSTWLPENHGWWMRDGSGNRIPGWLGGTEPFYLLNYNNPDFRAHVAQQAAAVVNSGVVDGVMLDIYDAEDASRIDLVQRIRTAIGPDKLIIVNSNANKPVGSAPYINGVYMEVDPNVPQWVASPTRAPSSAIWQQIVSTLQWVETTIQQPKINVLETWYTQSRDEPRNMRMTTAAALTLSNGYALFGDPNYLPQLDHAHDWYEFWNVDLGEPIEPPRTDADKVGGGFARDFTHGEVVFNPLFNGQSITRTFAEPRRQVTTGLLGTSFTIPSGDGDMFLLAGATPPADLAFESPNVAGVAGGQLAAGWMVVASALSGGLGLQDHAVAGINGGEGQQHLYLSDAGAASMIAVAPATPIGAVVADTRYTLAVGLGNQLTEDAYREPNEYRISIHVGGAEAASFTLADAGAIIPEGEFLDVMVTWDSPSAGPMIGSNLSVTLAHKGVVGANTQGVFDNVRLVMSPLTPGDFNLNGVVDGNDLLIWQRGVGLTQGATRGDGDADGDGAVTHDDLLVWSQGLNSGGPPPSAIVPEPGKSFWAILLTTLAAVGRPPRRSVGEAGGGAYWRPRRPAAPAKLEKGPSGHGWRRQTHDGAFNPSNAALCEGA